MTDTFSQPDIAVAACARPSVAYVQLAQEKSVLGTAARTAHVVSGFRVRIAEDVPGVLPRGVPV